MKLIRYGDLNKEKPGIHIDNVNYDVADFGEDYNEAFFESGGLSRLQGYINKQKDKLKPLNGNSRIGSPVARPSKLVCIGLNYADHARETGAALPPEPVIFMKSTTSPGFR